MGMVPSGEERGMMMPAGDRVAEKKREKSSVRGTHTRARVT